MTWVSKDFPGWTPSHSWVSTTLRQNGFSSRKAQFKKPIQLGPNFKTRIQIFQEKVNTILEEQKSTYLSPNIWVMDETGVWDQSTTIRTYTRKSNPKPYVKMKQTQNKRDTFVACISFKGDKIKMYGIEHKIRKISRRKNKKPKILDPGRRGMNRHHMYAWAKLFVSRAKEGDLLIMDNLGVHRNAKVKKLFEEKGIIVEFMPTYSAHVLSPLDNSLFHELKCGIRKEPFKTFQEKLTEVRKSFKNVSTSNIKRYFLNCGLPTQGRINPIKRKRKTTKPIFKGIPKNKRRNNRNGPETQEDYDELDMDWIYVSDPEQEKGNITLTLDLGFTD